MDGNGRWAKERLRPRFWGHIRGASKISSIVEKANQLGLKALTLYAFSTENIQRPKHEVDLLFKLLKKYLSTEQENLINNNVCFQVIGDISILEQDAQKLILETQKLCAHNTGLKLSFAFGYGGRKEIVDAVNRFILENPGQELSENKLAQYLYRPEIGDVDLLIRTAGDQRVSNFLLWQISYAELFFSKTKWPDFSAAELESIIFEVQSRERRFGKVSAQLLTATSGQSLDKSTLA